MGEGMGQPIAVTAEKNKTVIRNIDWLPGTGAVSATGTEAFQQALIQAGTAVMQAGGSYRLDLYMNKQSPDAASKSLGPTAGLGADGVPGGPNGRTTECRAAGRQDQAGRRSPPRDRQDQVTDD